MTKSIAACLDKLLVHEREYYDLTLYVIVNSPMCRYLAITLSN